MKVVLVATGYTSALEPLVQYKPTPLLRVADKPILFHVIEYLVAHGCLQFDIILHHLPQLVEESLQEGKRWGASFTFHLARNGEAPFDCLHPVAKEWGSDTLLLGRGDCLPKLFNGTQNDPTTLFYYPDQQWTGWGILPASMLAELAPQTSVESLPGSWQAQAHRKTVQPFLSVRTFSDLVHSNFRMITTHGTESLLPSTAHEVEKGIWISHGVSIYPGVKLKPPVFIGEHCQIKDHAQLGPQSIIENNCIIDSGSTIQRSLICQRSYVGEALTIQDSVVDRNVLIHLKHETSIVVRDDFILSELAPAPVLSYLYGWCEKLAAGVLLALFSPIYFYMKAVCKETTLRMLQLPAPMDKTQWTTFAWKSFTAKNGRQLNRFENYFKRLPVLVNIFRGDVHFVGVAPRTIDNVERLTMDWQKLYQRSKVGLITLADLDTGGAHSDDALYAAEAYYAVHMSFIFDFKLFLRWLLRKIG